MIEEVSVLSIEKSKIKSFYIECTLIFGEKITLILRDGGSYTDSTEDVAPYSMEEYLRRTIVSSHKYNNFRYLEEIIRLPIFVTDVTTTISLNLVEMI